MGCDRTRTNKHISYTFIDSTRRVLRLLGFALLAFRPWVGPAFTHAHTPRIHHKYTFEEYARADLAFTYLCLDDRRTDPTNPPPAFSRLAMPRLLSPSFTAHSPSLFICIQPQASFQPSFPFR